MVSATVGLPYQTCRMPSLGGRELEDPTGWVVYTSSKQHARRRTTMFLTWSAQLPPCSSPAAMPSVFAAGASLQAAGALVLELGGGGCGRAPSRRLPPRQSGNVLKSIQKFRAARAPKKKSAQPPTTLGVPCPDLVFRAAPPAAVHKLSEPSPLESRRLRGFFPCSSYPDPRGG